MRGEIYDFNDVVRFQCGRKVWIEHRYRKSDLFMVNKHNNGNVDFIIDKHLSKWSNLCLNYKQLEIKMKNNYIKIYEWLSNDEYLIRNIEKSRINIEVALILKNKSEFIVETSKYNRLIKEMEKRKLINL